MAHNLIAVGLKANISDLDQKLLPYLQDEHYFPVGDQNFGIMYSRKCKVGQWIGLTGTDDELIQWYEQYKDRRLKAYFTRMYATKKVVVLEGTVEGKPFLIVASNKGAGSSTFIHRKNAAYGHYGPPTIIERIEIEGEPYIYYSS